MADLAPAIAGTPATDALCRAIARQAGGVCLLGFSRGKDAVAAWLNLRRFFARVIPFHVASVPRLSFVDASLDYYEAAFGTRIFRFLDGDNLLGLHNLVYQPIEDEDRIEALDLWAYDKHDLCDLIRGTCNVPDAWCAYGINASDSIDRRVYVNELGGRSDNNRTFYPCFDWDKAAILGTIEASGLALADDYRLACRSLAGLPGVRHLGRMLELYPDDFARVEAMYPLIRAQLARNEFRRMHLQSETEAVDAGAD